MAIKFISDLHLSHKNILSFTTSSDIDWINNGYKIKDEAFNLKSIEEWNNLILAKWNKTVKEEDTVYILGDLVLGNFDLAYETLKNMKGSKILVPGNHDEKIIEKDSPFISMLSRCGFIEIDSLSYKEINVDGIKVVLSHYPIFSFNGEMSGAVHLYGHIHNIYNQNIAYYNAMKDLVICRDTTVRGKAYNVGCMCPWINYAPKTLQDIIKNFNSFIEDNRND